MVGTWLGEIRPCSCLAVLPDTAWVLLNKIYQPFFTSLYTFLKDDTVNAVFILAYSRIFRHKRGVQVYTCHL